MIDRLPLYCEKPKLQEGNVRAQGPRAHAVSSLQSFIWVPDMRVRKLPDGSSSQPVQTPHGSGLPRGSPGHHRTALTTESAQ